MCVYTCIHTVHTYILYTHMNNVHCTVNVYCMLSRCVHVSVCSDSYCMLIEAAVNGFFDSAELFCLHKESSLPSPCRLGCCMI